ncbi:MAG: hypothetical protein KF819_40695, partial [Labilithrix sp.]|nr:hypothetical protein [Labilithrix sp.]
MNKTDEKLREAKFFLRKVQAHGRERWRERTGDLAFPDLVIARSMLGGGGWRFHVLARRCAAAAIALRNDRDPLPW